MPFTSPVDQMAWYILVWLSYICTKNILCHKQWYYSILNRCGSEGVALYFRMEDTVMIVGKLEDQVSFIYTDPVFLVSEIDCVRVIGAFSNDLLQLVPRYVQDIFRINSTSPSSYLVEASKQFEVIIIIKC